MSGPGSNNEVADDVVSMSNTDNPGNIGDETTQQRGLVQSYARYEHIVSFVSAFLTSERDYRSVVPDVCEMLLKNLEARSILIFTRGENAPADVLNLEFVECLRNLSLPSYQIRFGEGLTGSIAYSRSYFSARHVSQKMLGMESRYNEYLVDKSVLAFPLFTDENVLGVLYFVFEDFPDSGLVGILTIIANIFTNYFQLVFKRKQNLRNQQKFSLLNSYRRVFSGTMELRPLLSVFMNITASTLAAEVGVFVLFKEDTRIPDLEVNWGIAYNDLLKLSYQDGTHFMDRLLDSREVISEGLGGNMPFFDHQEREGVINNILAGALWSKDRVLGLLVFANKITGPFDRSRRSFDTQDEELFSLMLEQVKNSVENYMLYRQIVSMKKLNENILRSIESGIISIDLEGRVLTYNKKAREMAAGQKLRKGMHISRFFPFEIFETDSFARSIEAGHFIQHNTEFSFFQEEFEIVLNFTLSTLRDEQGNDIGAVITVFDMTEKRNMERKVKRTENLAALGELSAGLAHEIKNPLTSMKGFAQLLPNRLEDKAFLQKFAAVVTNQVSRLDDITERLLTFARPNVGSLQEVCIPEVVDDCIMLVKFQIDKKKIVCKNEVSRELAPVFGNANRLSQVFLNIILNAVQAMELEGKLTIQAQTGPGGEFLPDAREAVYLDFVDTGKGVEESDINKLFNPFFTTKETGTGLGLAISYRIIEEHGGSIDVSSKKGIGTRVRVILPLKGDHDT